MFVCADGVVMKKLILLIFLLCALGTFSQELAFSEYEGTSSTSEKENLIKEPETTDFVKHLDGLNDKKLDRYLRKSLAAAVFCSSRVGACNKPAGALR